METKIRSNKGFTLIELVIVITILAVLAVIGMQTWGNMSAKSKASADVANAQTIANSFNRGCVDGVFTTTAPANTFVTADSLWSTLTTNTYMITGVPQVKAVPGGIFYVSFNSDGSAMKVAVSTDNAIAPDEIIYPRPSGGFTNTYYTVLN
ncbi:MAG: type II secretion system protein [Deltaproteobacteria bacterium]